MDWIGHFLRRIFFPIINVLVMGVLVLVAAAVIIPLPPSFPSILPILSHVFLLGYRLLLLLFD